MTIITVADAKALLDYDPATGHFTWKAQTGPRAKVGSRAGAAHNGYVRIKLLGRQYLAHRLAWLFMTGDWPALEIDHRDGDRANNRWANLREATRGQNRANAKVNHNNALGVKGVYRRGTQYAAHVTVDGEQIHLGTFPSFAKAVAVRRFAEKDLHGQFARAS